MCVFVRGCFWLFFGDKIGDKIGDRIGDRIGDTYFLKSVSGVWQGSAERKVRMF